MSDSLRCNWCGKFASKPLVHQPHTEVWKLEPNEPKLICVKCWLDQKEMSPPPVSGSQSKKNCQKM